MPAPPASTAGRPRTITNIQITPIARIRARSRSALCCLDGAGAVVRRSWWIRRVWAILVIGVILNAIPRPIAKDTCERRNAEDGYTPSRKLKHLIRARTATCSAPGCGAQAMHCDLDHVVPHPEGATCECNLHPACRRHHRCKQAPGWNVNEPEPGTIQWTTPAGRTYTTYTTNPTIYDL